MRTPILIVIGAMTIIALLVAVPTGTVSQAQAPSPTKAVGSINVVGDAQINVVPDQVIMTFGIETWDKNLIASKTANDQRMSSMMTLVKSLDIDSKQVQTDYMRVEPRYKDSYEQRDFIGFLVRRNIVITLKDTSKFDALLSGALGSGVNFIHNIEFRTTELRKYRDQARTLAIKAAREKAELLAGELGQKVGRATSISEDPYVSWGYYGYWYWWGGRYSSGGNVSQNVVQNAQSEPSGNGSNSDSTLAPGQIGVRSRVTVVFELMDK